MSGNKGLIGIGRYGEGLFRRYLEHRGIPFEYEPILEDTSRLIDFVLQPPGQEKVYIEVKTIYKAPPRSSGIVHPYGSVRSEITEGMRKFRKLPDALNAIALVNFPWSFVDIRSPHVMLGSMYGDAGFEIPFDTQTGQGDSNAMTETFIRRDGMMLRSDRIQNSRLCALISVHSLDTYAPDFISKTITMADAVAQFTNRTNDTDFAAPYVTVWDNAAGKRGFPAGLFEGPMDARWSYDGNEQFQSFVGEERRAVQIEGIKRGMTIY